MYKMVGADGREYGPVSADQLREWIAEGRADAQTKVLPEGATEWKLLGDLAEFRTTLGPSAPVSPPPAYRPTAARKTNSMATLGLVMGIISVSFGLCCCYGMPFNVLGVIFSLIGLSQIRQDPLGQQGKGVALAGLILSLVGILFALVLFSFGVAVRMPDIMRRVYRL